mgnify:CR=1 FL=1|tara:strand:- start:114 stop:503 length:390 start_codon:yes stop_codon:yes gene_type:complete
MRVNISFSVDLDEVPKRVAQFVEEAGASLQEVGDSIEDILSRIGSEDYIKSVEEVAKLRDLLASVDFKLEDCMNILDGYTKALVEMPKRERESQQSSPPTPEQMAWATQQIKELQEKKDELDFNDEESG